MGRSEIRAVMLAGAVTLAGPLLAQGEARPDALAASLAQAEAARARLDLPAALATLNAAIETAPEAAAPLIARAAIHRAMGRLSLALADLDAALALAPDDAEALAQRAETLRRAGAVARAAADFARARALRPDDPGLAAAEAAALADAGRKSDALAAYVRAADLAPDDDDVRAARDTLLAELAETTRPDFVFEADALVGEAFTIGEGVAAAPNHLILVRDGAELATDGAVAPDRLARAVAAGVVRITHVFTYSGRNSTIWANLALICAGPALGATEAALIATEGRHALAEIERGNGTGALEALITAAYGLGGQDQDRVGDCAFDRDHALRYLADWTAAQERIGWRGETYLDRAPAYVLNGTPVAAGWLDAWLAAEVPPDAGVAQDPVIEGESSGDAPVLGAFDGADPAPMDGGDGEPASGEIAQEEVDKEAAPDSSPEAPDGGAQPLAPVAVAEAALAGITLPPPVERPVTGPEATDVEDPTAEETLEMPDDAAPAAPDPAIADEPEPAPKAEPDLAELAEADSPEGSAGEAPAKPEPAPGADAAVQTPGSGADEGGPDGPEAADPEPDDPEPDEAQPDENEPDPAAPGDTPPKPAAEDVRLARILKGIWAPSLTQCLAYLDAIETPETLDQAMPDPAADPPLGAMLVTSRRAQSFDARGQVCVVESFSETGEESDALLSCTDSDGGVGTMRLHAYPSGGPTPWLDVTRGTEDIVAMRQCLTLGQLGVRFADLWQIDKTACTASAPMRGIEVAFRPEGGDLWLTLRPVGENAALPGPDGLTARVDDVALTPGAGAVEDGSYSAPLGAFDEVARHLSFGMFLFLTARDEGGFTPVRLPLLGSSRAMSALADCAQ